MLLLHGFTGGPCAWDLVVARLGTSKSIVRPVLLGHGPDLGQRAVACPTFDEEVDRVAQLLRQVHRRKVHLGGYSLGGRVALGLLVRHPELFDRATLIGVNPGLKTAEERSERQRCDQRWIDLLESKGIEAFLAAWEAQPLFASQNRLPRDLQEIQRSHRLRHCSIGLAQSMRVLGLSQMPCYWDDLARITIPVTLMVGDEDEKFRQIALEMVSRLPNGRVVTVPRAGHNLLLERPDAVAQELEPAPISSARARSAEPRQQP